MNGSAATNVCQLFGFFSSSSLIFIKFIPFSSRPRAKVHWRNWVFICASAAFRVLSPLGSIIRAFQAARMSAGEFSICSSQSSLYSFTLLLSHSNPPNTSSQYSFGSRSISGAQGPIRACLIRNPLIRLVANCRYILEVAAAYGTSKVSFR